MGMKGIDFGPCCGVWVPGAGMGQCLRSTCWEKSCLWWSCGARQVPGECGAWVPRMDSVLEQRTRPARLHSWWLWSPVTEVHDFRFPPLWPGEKLHWNL